MTAYRAEGSPPTSKFNFNVIIAEIPSTISFVESNYQGENVIFTKTGDEDISEEDVTCKVSHVRPAPTFQWMIGILKQSFSFENDPLQVQSWFISMTLKPIHSMQVSAPP